MHREAREWVARFATTENVSVLDIGGRDINGSVRELFPGSTDYVSVDLYKGPGVDVACDITLWDSTATFDVILCCEVLEHAENWKDIIANAYARCRAGGLFVITCAGPGRKEHSGIDGDLLHEDEYYGNVSPGELEAELAATDWSMFTVDQLGTDVRSVAQK